MPTLNSAQFEQNVHDNAASAMDTTPINQVVDPTFLSAISPPHPESVLQSQLQSSQAYIDKSDSTNTIMAPLHVSMPDLTASDFISSMEALDNTIPTIHTAPAAFVGDFAPHPDPFSVVRPLENSMNVELATANHVLSTSSPQSQVQSPTMHGSSSSYSAGVTSSLDSALDPTGVSTARSRASTSVSPPTNSTPFNQLPTSQHQHPHHLAFSDVNNLTQEEAVLLGAPEPHFFLVPLLKQ